MSLMRFYYDPFTEFDRLFDDAFATRFRPTSLGGETGRGRETAQRMTEWRPRMDLIEGADTVTAKFDLPGMKTEDVTVDVHGDRLIVSGESDVSESREEGGFAVRERAYGKFSRTLALPQGTKPDDVKAKMEHGVLTVNFPRAQPEQVPKRITIG
ncbi:small heat shock protein [Phlebopus sp. FC_14]|nr:small heat shock protein [Phlebopus sp. FC_14]